MTPILSKDEDTEKKRLAAGVNNDAASIRPCILNAEDVIIVVVPLNYYNCSLVLSWAVRGTQESAVPTNAQHDGSLFDMCVGAIMLMRRRADFLASSRPVDRRFHDSTASKPPTRTLSSYVYPRLLHR